MNLFEQWMSGGIELSDLNDEQCALLIEQWGEADAPEAVERRQRRAAAPVPDRSANVVRYEAIGRKGGRSLHGSFEAARKRPGVARVRKVYFWTLYRLYDVLWRRGLKPGGAPGENFDFATIGPLERLARDVCGLEPAIVIRGTGREPELAYTRDAVDMLTEAVRRGWDSPLEAEAWRQGAPATTPRTTERASS